MICYQRVRNCTQTVNKKTKNVFSIFEDMCFGCCVFFFFKVFSFFIFRVNRINWINRFLFDLPENLLNTRKLTLTACHSNKQERPTDNLKGNGDKTMLFLLSGVEVHVSMLSARRRRL